MEVWVTVLVALVVALSTLGATFLQNRHSAKRFDKELKRARETDYRQRRWEIRGEPLLKLRNELAKMAFQHEKWVAAAQMQHTRFGVTEEQAKEELQSAANQLNNYLSSGELAQTLFIQYDAELVNEVEEIQRDYRTSYFYHLSFEKIDTTKLMEATNVFKRNKDRIIKVQELINKQLEEL